MVKQALSYQEALDRARSNRLYLKILFGISILGTLGDLRHLEGSMLDLLFMSLNLLVVVLSYFLVRTCFVSYVVLLFATKIAVIGLHLLGPLTSEGMSVLTGYGIVGTILYFFAFLACRRIQRYLLPIPVSPEKPQV